MAKYQSTLTGPQMDAALAALPDAEAYAKGTRAGQDVSPGDPTYHNNAKYYAQNAGQSAASASTSASVAATSATNSSNSATNSANSAAASAGSATTAGQQAQRAEDAADRAEAIVGGKFVSYGQAQGLSDAQKAQARANIGLVITSAHVADEVLYITGAITVADETLYL